jgi:hypothetical protein
MSLVWTHPELDALLRWRMAPAGEAVPEARPDASVRLRRSGTMPLVFEGMLLASHQGTEQTGRRHTIRLYETTDETYVVEIVLSDPDGSAPAFSMAEEADSLEEVLAVLSSHDPASQAAFHGGMTGDIAAEANKLFQEATRLRHDFNMACRTLFPADDARLERNEKGSSPCQ